MTHVNAIYHRLASTCHSQFVSKHAVPSFSSLTNTEGPQFYKGSSNPGCFALIVIYYQLAMEVILAMKCITSSVGGNYRLCIQNSMCKL